MSHVVMYANDINSKGLLRIRFQKEIYSQSVLRISIVLPSK